MPLWQKIKTKDMRIFVKILLVVIMISCSKEIIKEYEINDVTLYTSASEKKNLKSDEQFIAILYTDIYGKSISNSEFKALQKAYTSLGDKKIIIDIMIKASLADTVSAEIPTLSTMQSDPVAFVDDTYKRFLVRKPTQQETWFLVNQIEKNNGLKPIDIYYAMLTSEEYRYY